MHCLCQNDLQKCQNRPTNPQKTEEHLKTSGLEKREFLEIGSMAGLGAFDPRSKQPSFAKPFVQLWAVLTQGSKRGWFKKGQAIIDLRCRRSIKQHRLTLAVGASPLLSTPQRKGDIVLRDSCCLTVSKSWPVAAAILRGCRCRVFGTRRKGSRRSDASR